MARKPPVVHGAVLIDKPAGMTSHDVVGQLRKRFGERRIGHAGTLDPDATGVLVIGVGNATRLLRFATASEKTYEVEIVFGTETDTLDASGQMVAEHDMSFDYQQIEAATASLTGEIEQVPPMVSARRVGGRRLYEIAREGLEVDRESRSVVVSRFEVEATDDPLIWRALRLVQRVHTSEHWVLTSEWRWAAAPTYGTFVEHEVATTQLRKLERLMRRPFCRLRN